MKHKKKLIVFGIAAILSAGLLLTIFQNNSMKIGRSEISQYAFVASKQSEVYHKPTCRWAQKIAEYNLVGFRDIEEAEKSGRRPCKVCKPR